MMAIHRLITEQAPWRGVLGSVLGSVLGKKKASDEPEPTTRLVF